MVQFTCNQKKNVARGNATRRERSAGRCKSRARRSLFALASRINGANIFQQLQLAARWQGGGGWRVKTAFIHDAIKARAATRRLPPRGRRFCRHSVRRISLSASVQTTRHTQNDEITEIRDQSGARFRSCELPLSSDMSDMTARKEKRRGHPRITSGKMLA